MFLELSGTIVKYYCMYIPNAFLTTRDQCTTFTHAAGHDGPPGYVILGPRLLTQSHAVTLHLHPSESQELRLRICKP